MLQETYMWGKWQTGEMTLTLSSLLMEVCALTSKSMLTNGLVKFLRQRKDNDSQRQV